MATLPTSSQVIDSGVTNAQQKIYFGNMLDFLLAMLGSDSADKATARANLGVAPRATRIDIASVAGTVDITADAPNTDDIRITGALAITGFTIAIGRVIRVTAGGAFSLANNASIVTQTGGTLTMQAGDTFELRATAANVVEVLNYTRGTASQTLVQTVATTSGAVATGTTIMPYDDTIPQQTEGDQYMSVTITPKNALNILEVEVVAHLSSSLANFITSALFRDATAGAVAGSAGSGTSGSQGAVAIQTYRYRVVAGSTSATTFKFRAGPSSAATLTFNGSTSARLLGGAIASSLIVRELTP